jgi:purine nucleosidase
MARTAARFPGGVAFVAVKSSRASRTPGWLNAFFLNFAILRRVKTPILIDTDTASDDAVALIMALRHPSVRVLAITTVAGNVAVRQATRNALYTAQLCSAKVPVYSGAEKPLTRSHESAHWFHGQDGLGDHNYPAPLQAPEKQHAVDAIIAAMESNPGLVLVTLGPLTNVALALQRNAIIAANVGRCVIMGGAPCSEGNVTPAAEYNIWCDPEAARIVFHSGLPIEMVGWHLCRGDAALSLSDIEHVLRFDTPLARFAIECNSRAQQAYLEQTGEHGISLPDPVAMSIALDPSIVTSQSEHFVDIEATSELTRGMTVVDRLNVAGNDRNWAIWAPLLNRGIKTKVPWTIDNARWKQALYAALR